MQPSRTWIRCERGHLFYSANSTTRCHVCVAHGLVHADESDLFVKLVRHGNDKRVVNDCAEMVARQRKIGGWVRLPSITWHGDNASITIRSREVAEAWRSILNGYYGSVAIYCKGEFNHAQHAADEEAYILRKSCEYLRQPAPMPTIGTTVERVPDVIVTPQPAREPQPVELHDGHVAARRKWRKALADMLREERASREGQSAFRAAVLANYGGRCAITGTAADVEAAHIEPWRENGNQEPDNGIPMAWALHKCYDRFPAMFAIHPDTLRIHVRPDAVGLEGYDGRQIADGQHTPLNRDALRARWAAFVATAS